MHKARSKVMTPPVGVSDNVGLLVSDEPGNQKEADRIQDTGAPELPEKLYRSTVSVPMPSSSRTSSDGKIKIFSTGRSRSSSSKSSVTSLGSIGTNYWTPAELYLTDRTVCYRLHSQEQQVCEMLLEDLVGVKYSAFKGGKECEFKIHLYPLITKRFARKKVRRLVDVVVLFDKEENFKDNEDEAALWKNRILVQANKASRKIFEYPEITTESTIANGDEDLLRQRYFLVLLNPMAGAQKGENRYNTYVKPMFELADIKCDVRKTKHQNYAHDLVQNLNLSRYDGIIISSGDGLIYEIVNGLMNRPDWEEVIKIPIGMLPTGSGNALAASTLYESNEDFNLETAAFQIIRGGFTPLDLATVQTSDNETCYMTLLANWGIVADVDIESESMRSIGEARFVLGALNCIRKLKVYRGRVSYIVADDSRKDPEPVVVKSELLEPAQPYFEDDDPESFISSIKSLGNMDDDIFSCGCQKENNTSDSQSQNGSIDSAQEAQEASATSSVRPDQTLYIPSHREQVLYGPPTDLLVPLGNKLPDSWVSMEDDFLNVAPLMIPHMSRTVFGDPNFEIGSGKIRLMLVNGTISRYRSFKMFSDSETGKHVDMNEVKMVDVKAFRIEPLDCDDNGIMTVDGERVKKYGPIQAQIHPHLAMVMSRKRRKENMNGSSN